MKCPNCSVDLVMSERQGVEIDYCPKCRGVWLDRGEIDKIIDRSVPAMPAGQPEQQVSPKDRAFANLDCDDSHHGYSYKRRKSWLGELFD